MHFNSQSSSWNTISLQFNEKWFYFLVDNFKTWTIFLCIKKRDSVCKNSYIMSRGEYITRIDVNYRL